MERKKRVSFSKGLKALLCKNNYTPYRKHEPNINGEKSEAGLFLRVAGREFKIKA